MATDRDHYESYYADKLWNLLPEVYRAEDAASPDEKGPLRELVERIGVQAAVLRRGIDRLWEDQSIESCDEWVTPYLGDLLATNLVSSLDARGKRLDVAKTIYYRRRKGTVAILEEIAVDITGWEARVVEFFRRLSRSRHGIDPPLGLPTGGRFPDRLQSAQGLVGALTRTGAGGFADLRSLYGALQSHEAFDEFAHWADLRRGRGRTGWHNIPRLGVFLWRLKSFAMDQVTPVQVDGCQNTFSFDPTGREIPLFAAASRSEARQFGDQWISPEEWQLPTPISRALLSEHRGDLYPGSLGIYAKAGSQYELLPHSLVKLDPERGRFQGGPDGGPVFATYHFGFSSTIGAGPYDRRVLREVPIPAPEPLQAVQGGGSLTVAAGGTTIIGDSLTYTPAANVADVKQATLRSENKRRPLVRLGPGTTWEFTGKDDSSVLALEGIFLSGGDVVLKGEFALVALRCVTLDPGTSGTGGGAVFEQAVDGRQLGPVRLWIEGRIRRLMIERSIVGPVRARAGGIVESLEVRDSIVQAIPTAATSDPALSLADGEVALERVTVMGAASVHRLRASETILDGVAAVEDVQRGCVRFSAWVTGSVLPRQYESVEIPAGAPIFTARFFGFPGYAQVLDEADAQIVGSGDRGSITQGAQDGSEMGAFACERRAIKERSLRIKLQEFMPIGLIPVLIHVT